MIARHILIVVLVLSLLAPLARLVMRPPDRLGLPPRLPADGRRSGEALGS
jgi:hypothetical protein